MASFRVWPEPLCPELFGERVEYDGATKTLAGVIKFGAELGSGKFGKVHAVSMPGVPVGIVAKTQSYQGKGFEAYSDRVARELDFGFQLRHPNIVACLGAMQTETWAILFLERVDGVSLGTYMSRGAIFSEPRLRGVLSQALHALHYLQTARVLHLDLKESNIMVSHSGETKLIDFGVARQIPAGQDKIEYIRQNMYCHPPEMNDADMGGVDHKSIIFFLGAMLYRLAAHRLAPDAQPFGKTTGLTWQEQNSAMMNSFDDKAQGFIFLSFGLQALIRDMLAFCPDLRPCAEQALHYPWFKVADYCQEPQLRVYRKQERPSCIKELVPHVSAAMCSQFGIGEVQLLEKVSLRYHWQSVVYEYRTLRTNDTQAPLPACSQPSTNTKGASI
eukprot:scpid98173/ scgid15125/ Death-associated protein kinase 3; DAP-like kinase; MYPT1 kinase; ZIP-kinase